MTDQPHGTGSGHSHARAPLARGHVPGGDGDSAGVPWHGRELRPTGFEGDTGEADAALVAAADAVRASEGDPGTAEGRLVAALASARLLVPIVAVEEDEGADMAVVTLTAPDGARGLPLFSGVAQLAAWDPAARPVPVSAAVAARAAFSEGCDVALLDLGGAGGPVVIRSSMLWALGEGRAWAPGWEDEVVRGAVRRAVSGEPAVATAATGAGPAGATVVTLSLQPGLGKGEVQALLERVGARLAGEDEARLRLDSLSFRLQALA